MREALLAGGNVSLSDAGDLEFGSNYFYRAPYYYPYPWMRIAGTHLHFASDIQPLASLKEEWQALLRPVQFYTGLAFFLWIR